MSVAAVGDNSTFGQYVQKQIKGKMAKGASEDSIFSMFDGGASGGGSGLGSNIVNYAKKFLGCNESDGSADKFLGGGSSAATPWCAAFVQYIMEHVLGNKAPSWYKNVSNKWYCPTILEAAQSAHATVNTAHAKPGDIVLFGDHHIGIVASNKNGTITTIEGNSSDQVRSNTYSTGDGSLTICKMA